MILGLLENFYRNCNDGHSGGGTGKFTESGCTVGECILFSSLHCVFMIDPSVFGDPQFTGVNTFYQRFKALPETQTILNDRKNVFQQYFLKPEGFKKKNNEWIRTKLRKKRRKTNSNRAMSYGTSMRPVL